MIVSSYIPSYSANSINVMKMAEALADEGYSVMLIARTKKSDQLEPVKEDLFEYYAVKQNFKIKLNGIVNLRLFYTHVIFDILLYRPYFFYTRNLVIALLSSILRFNTIYHCHAIIDVKKKSLIQRIFRIKHFKAFAVVSEGLKSYYINKYNLKDEDIRIISNGVDLKRFTPVISKNEARDLCNLKKQIKIICYTGHLYEGRGIDLLIKLSERLADYKFVIVGGLEEDIHKWKSVADKNIYFKGFVPNSAVPLYLFSADILVMPYSNKVGIFQGGTNTGAVIRPIKLFEYMAACRPIVSSDLPGLREVLNNENAFFAQANDLDAWEKAIRVIENNPEKALQVSEKARSDVMNYSFDVIAKQVRNLVEQW